MRTGDHFTPSDIFNSVQTAIIKQNKRNGIRNEWLRTPEEKKLQKIKAMIDEPRIDRMVEWIKEYNLDYYVGGILDRARAKNPANPMRQKGRLMTKSNT